MCHCTRENCIRAALRKSQSRNMVYVESTTTNRRVWSATAPFAVAAAKSLPKASRIRMHNELRAAAAYNTGIYMCTCIHLASHAHTHTGILAASELSCTPLHMPRAAQPCVCLRTNAHMHVTRLLHRHTYVGIWVCV
uniref:Uncharacterized protein n=1 Tax=Trichogramma kaykai TaxID=54128 RepID=A0ABD2WI74_9HYME